MSSSKGKVEKKQKSGKRMKFIIIAVFVILLLPWIFYGGREFLTTIQNKQKLKEYIQTEGRVIDRIEEERTQHQHSGGRKKRYRTNTYTVYSSIVEYSVDNVTYTLIGPAYTSQEEIGTEKIVFYNPLNPAESLMEEDIDDSIYMLFIMTIFLAVIVLFWGLVFRFLFQLFR